MLSRQNFPPSSLFLHSPTLDKMYLLYLSLPSLCFYTKHSCLHIPCSFLISSGLFFVSQFRNYYFFPHSRVKRRYFCEKVHFFFYGLIYERCNKGFRFSDLCEQERFCMISALLDVFSVWFRLISGFPLHLCLSVFYIFRKLDKINFLILQQKCFPDESYQRGARGQR